MIAIAIMRTVRIHDCDCHAAVPTKVLRLASIRTLVREVKVLWVRKSWVQPEPTQHDVFRSDLMIEGRILARQLGLTFVGSVRNRGTADVSLLEMLAETSTEDG